MKATPRALEKWLQKNEHRAARMVTYKGHHIYLSEGGPYFDTRQLQEFPLGWYESAYAIGDGERVTCIQVLQFDKLHDKDLTEESRAIGRVNSAKAAAINFLEDAYEANHRH